MRNRCLYSQNPIYYTFQTFCFILVSCASAGNGEGVFGQGEYTEPSMCEPMTIVTCQCPDGLMGIQQCFEDGTIGECDCLDNDDSRYIENDSGVSISISSSTNALDMSSIHKSNGAGWAVEDTGNLNSSKLNDGSQSIRNPFDMNDSLSSNSCPANFLCEKNELLNILFHDLYFCTNPNLYLLHGIIGATPPSCSSTNECAAMGLTGSHCIGITSFGIAYCLSTCSP